MENGEGRSPSPSTVRFEKSSMPIRGDVIHTVNFFQGAFTIILALALGEALKSFISEDQNQPLHWERLPALLAFMIIFFQFFESMAEYFYSTYLNPKTSLEFVPGYLIFDSILFMLEGCCFFMMSRSLAPHRWRRFYGSVLTLMLIDIGWTGINQLRGLHVGAWLAIDTATVLVILLMMWWQRGKADSMRPSYIGLTLIAVTSVLAYWLERDMYLP
jgi:hypothetical protein